ncbi:MAG: GTPase ObgE, partial [Acidaminococcales bacterium]|nr:GTPase ObgE [Acidaminococcales bacterium]
MFTDRARIYVRGGKGGDGMLGFRREKYVPRGGPSGGDGGRGGSVILLADENINTLVDFRHKRKFEAKPGGRGGMSNCFGAAAPDIVIKVPVGTLVYGEKAETPLYDLKEHGQKFTAARGGRGGRGNAKFADSVNRAPAFAEKGEPGEGRWLRLELKLLADIGLIGYPSVGKSSIIARVSAAKPEIAAYHFTTLSPVLGVVSVGEEASFVLADIPGLIEGAHSGAGLGHDFLRHIERTRAIIHVVDASGLEGRDPIEDFNKINEELALYSGQLAARPQLVAANKMDLPAAGEQYSRLAAHAESKGYAALPVSAASGEGLPDLVRRAWEMLKDAPAAPEICTAALPAEDGGAFAIRREDDGTFCVTGRNIEKLVSM